MIGTELDGRYRVVRELGAGAMGQVWLAEHLALGRLEALKVLRPELSETAELVARFRREARATNRLQHPNIVAVYDFGQLPDGRYFLTTEYADGETVDQELFRNGPFALARALHVLIQLADAVGHAHSRGVIHRDLKPSNLCLIEHRGRSDVLKVLDFGIAKIISPDYEDSIDQTDGGSVFGTPGYMAPELLAGQRADHRVDHYAMGCIAFELVTGRPPFTGQPMMVMHQHLTEEPAPPSQFAPGLPPELDSIVLRCLAKEPGRRFRNPAVLSAALKEVPGYRSDPGSGRRTIRSMQLPLGRATADTVDEWTEQTDVERDVTGSARTLVNQEIIDQARDERRRALRALADALLDAGCNSIDLVLALGDVVQADDQVQQLQSELDEIDRTCDVAEQRARESEAALRFAVAELRFHGAKRTGGEEPVATTAAKISELEQRLASIAPALASELERQAERGIELTARLDDAEHSLNAHCAALAELTAALAPGYADHPLVATASQRVDAATLLSRRGPRPS